MATANEMAVRLWDAAMLACFCTGVSIGCWLSVLMTWLEMRKR